MKGGLALLLALAAAGPAAAGEPATLLDAMQVAYGRVEGYTAVFVRQERVAGGLRPREEAVLKFRRPERLYLRWLTGPRSGREILFVRGREGDRALVHEPGPLTRFLTLVMAPDHPRVLRESRHPITDVGLGRLVDLITGNGRRALERGEGRLADREVVGDGGRPGRLLELVLARDPGRGYDCYRAEVVVDAETGLPVRTTVFDWDDRMVGDYVYRDLRLNPPLTDQDFDPANPEYAFPQARLAL